MASTLKIRGGDSATVGAITPAARELLVNTDTDRVHVGDGSTVGGNPLALLSDVTSSTGTTNLSGSGTASVYTIASDTGTDATIPAATTSAAGVMTAADKTSLDALVATGGSTDLALANVTASTVDIASSNGTDATITAATNAAAGVATAAQITELEAIRTLSGTLNGATDLGPFSGITIPDASSTKSALQAIETELEMHDVFYVLAMGQSNMVGAVAGGDISTNEKVKIWNTANTAWETWDLSLATAQIENSLGVNFNNIAFHFAKKYAQENNVEVRVIVSALGSQAISQWVPDTAPRYVNMESQVAAAGVTKFNAVLWHQGESDYLAPGSYEANFDLLISQLRAETYIDADTPIIAGQVASVGPRSPINEFFNISTFERKYFDQNVFLALIGDYETQFDDIHFTGESLAKAGRVGYWKAFSESREEIPFRKNIRQKADSLGGYTFGAGQFLQATGNIITAGVPGFTISATVTPTTVNNNIFYSEYDNTLGTEGFFFGITALSRPVLALRQGGTVATVVANGTDLKAGTSYNITATCENGAQAIYVDGVRVATGAIAWTAAEPPRLPRISSITTAGVSTGQDFLGDMKELAIFGVAKNEWEVSRIVSGDVIADDLLLLLNPSSSSDSGWDDLSGNDNHFLNYGAAAQNASNRDLTRKTLSGIFLESQFNERPYAVFDGDTDFYTVPAVNVGANDFTFHFRWKLDALPTSFWTLYRVAPLNNGVLVYVFPTYYRVDFFDPAASVTSFVIPVQPTTEIEDIAITCDRDGLMSFFRNGVKHHTVDISAESDVLFGSAGTHTLGYTGANFQGRISRFGLLNRVLSDSEATALTQGFAELPYADLGAQVIAQTSGTLEYGKRYLITNYIAGDDFLNVGASANASGETFIASGTTPTAWANGTSLLQTGYLVRAYESGIGNTAWIEGSGNANHLIPTGATGANLKIAGTLDVEIIRISDTHWIGVDTGKVSVSTDAGVTWAPLH